MTQELIVFIGSDSKSMISFRLDLMLFMQQKLAAKVITYLPQDSYFKTAQEILARHNIGVRIIPLKNTSLNPIKDVLYCVRVWRQLTIDQPEMIFLITVKPVIYGLLAAFFARIPKAYAIITGLGHVYTFEDIKTKCLRFFVNLLYRVAFLKANRVFFQNHDDAKVFENYHLVKQNQIAITAGSGVNLNDFPKTPLQPLPPIRFLFIGRLLKAKGLFEYIDAAKFLSRKYRDVRFQVLGGFHSNPSNIARTELFKLFEDSGIEYLGEQESSLGALSDAHVIVLPSYREGTPRALLEAMAVGRPIITTNVPGCKDLINEQDNGLLVQPQDPMELIKAMEYLINNPNFIPNMGDAGYLLARNKYSVHLVNDFIYSKL